MNRKKETPAANIGYTIWPFVASFIILVRNENRSWQKHFTTEENYFLFVFATCNFIILLTKAATSHSRSLGVIVGQKIKHYKLTERKKANASEKLKEVFATTQADSKTPHLILPNRTKTIFNNKILRLNRNLAEYI